MTLIEMTSVFTPADGSAPRSITIRISDLRQDAEDELWSVAVDVVGFKTDDHVRLKGADWLSASIDGTMGFVRGLAGGKVQDDGGTIKPLLLPLRDSEPTGIMPAGGWLRPPVEPIPAGPRGPSLVEVASVFTPADGSAPRSITIRISDLRQEPDEAWSVIVDVLGFEADEHMQVRGADWVNALEGAALFLREFMGGKVQSSGTITPILYFPPYPE
jgi:hypothetical protein